MADRRESPETADAAAEDEVDEVDEATAALQEEVDEAEQFVAAAEALSTHGSSRKLHDGKGGKSTTAGSAAAECTVIRTVEQAFSMDFHPTRALAVAGLITGQIKVYDFSDSDAPVKFWSCRPHGNACRAVRFTAAGDGVLSGSSDCSLQLRDLEANRRSWRAKDAHGEPINTLSLTGPHGVATGDDGGAVKVWDVRQRAVALSFFEHTDLINDMLFVDASDGPTLCVGSGDGCLSIFDLRKGRLAALSDNQDDELLSLALMKGGKKLLTGFQSGVVGVWSWGNWGDISDRLLGHPESVDAHVTHSGPTRSTVAQPRAIQRPDAPGAGLAQPPSPRGAHVARLGACTSPVGLTPSGLVEDSGGQCAHCVCSGARRSRPSCSRPTCPNTSCARASPSARRTTSRARPSSSPRRAAAR